LQEQISPTNSLAIQRSARARRPHLQALRFRPAEQVSARKYPTAKAKMTVTRPHLQAQFVRHPRACADRDRVAAGDYARRIRDAHGDIPSSTVDCAQPTFAVRAARFHDSRHLAAACSFASAGAALVGIARPHKSIAPGLGPSAQTSSCTRHSAAFASALAPQPRLPRARKHARATGWLASAPKALRPMGKIRPRTGIHESKCAAGTFHCALGRSPAKSSDASPSNSNVCRLYGDNFDDGVITRRPPFGVPHARGEAG
jgi:hypothetical protein